jgi:hypothetical protein
MDPYLVVTVSYIDETLPEEDDENPTWRMVSTIIAYRKIEGPHTAETFAEILHGVFDEYEILHKVQNLFSSHRFSILMSLFIDWLFNIR